MSCFGEVYACLGCLPWPLQVYSLSDYLLEQRPGTLSESVHNVFVVGMFVDRAAWGGGGRVSNRQMTTTVLRRQAAASAATAHNVFSFESLAEHS